VMAISTIQSEFSCMKTVIVRDRLCGLVTNAGVLRSGVISDAGGYSTPNHT
jgi:hypothetical protein